MRGRGRELEEIKSFAQGSEGYRWLVGDAYTGKTALLAAAIAALPEEVDVVSYFLSRREGDADSNRFVTAVVLQLAALLEVDVSVPDAHHFRSLWERAVNRLDATDRHLLLVVDGLDEDLWPVGSPSVGRLLPDRVGRNAHVLVSSRPNPELPDDLKAGHPLLDLSPTNLQAFKGAAEQAEQARQEIEDLKKRDEGLGTDLLAVLTAAAGPLAVADLAMLTSDGRGPTASHERRVDRLVTKDTARSLEPVGDELSLRYQFAHASLLEYANTDKQLSHPSYWERICRWAEGWANAGWPSGDTPADSAPGYLLDAYPSAVADRKELNRLAELVSDIGWVDTAVARIGVYTVLASLRMAAQTTSGRDCVVSMLQMLEQQAHQLRRPAVANQIGHAATALAWRALQLGLNDRLVAAVSERHRTLPGPQVIPVATTERANPRLVSELGHHGGAVLALAASGEGLVVSGGEDWAVRLWDPAGDRGRHLGRRHGRVAAVAVSGEGLVVAGGDDGAVVLGTPAPRATPGASWAATTAGCGRSR